MFRGPLAVVVEDVPAPNTIVEFGERTKSRSAANGFSGRRTVPVSASEMIASLTLIARAGRLSADGTESDEQTPSLPMAGGDFTV